MNENFGIRQFSLLRVKILIAICCFFLYFDGVGCYKILGLFPYPARSHYTVFEALMVELAKRGHNVINYNTFPKTHPLPNYHEVSIKHCFSLPNILTLEEMRKIANSFKATKGLFQFGARFEEINDCAPLRQLWNSAEKFDLMITETFATEIFQLFAYKLDIPVMKFHSNTPLPWMSDQLALPDNPSYIPFSYTGFSDRMNFFQRCENLLVHLYAKFHYMKSERIYDNMAKEIFGSSTPPIGQVLKNTNVILFYTHFSLNYPRPNTPGAIEVAGLHITEAKAIPQVRFIIISVY